MWDRAADSRAVESVLAGDGGAFSAILDRYGDRVYGLVRRITGDGEEAKDVTQEIFVKVYRSLGRWNGTSAFSTWLYRVAYNAAVSHVRKHSRRPPSVDEKRLEAMADDAPDTLFAKFADEKRHAALEAALMELPADERALVTLFYMEDRPVAEVAAIAGISAANAKVRLHRVRKKLFILMSDEHGITTKKNGDEKDNDE